MFRSEEEAQAALAEARERLISDGYNVAVELAEEHGAVHSQMILTEMENRGLFEDGDEDLPRNWTSNIFRQAEYKDTWSKCGYAKIGDNARNTHAAVRAVWKLKDTPTPAWAEAVELGAPGPDVINSARAELARMHRFAEDNGFEFKEDRAVNAVASWLRELGRPERR